MGTHTTTGMDYLVCMRMHGAASLGLFHIPSMNALELEHFWLPPLLFAPHDSWRRSFRMASILALVMKAAARSVTPREVEP